MQRKPKLILFLLIGALLTAAGCQMTGSFPFVSHRSGLPAQSE